MVGECDDDDRRATLAFMILNAKFKSQLFNFGLMNGDGCERGYRGRRSNAIFTACHHGHPEHHKRLQFTYHGESIHKTIYLVIQMTREVQIY